jgi:hypothetical protein
MLIQTKIQIDAKDYHFVKMAYKDLKYKSLSEYMRTAVHSKVKVDRQKLREMKRERAMDMIGRVAYENVFESLDGEDFEQR